MRGFLWVLWGVSSGCGQMAMEAPADLGPTEPNDLAMVRPDGSIGSGYLRLIVTDDQTGLPLPARVLLKGVPPTATPEFDKGGKLGKNGTPIGLGVLGAPDGLILPVGDGALPLVAGTYDLFVTHGPEWEAHTQRITLDGKANLTVHAPLRHSVDTRGWMAADLHVHTGRSFDAKGMRVDDRVISEVAVGVEVIVSTDHNVLTDLQPEVEHLGYQQVARAIVGDEFNFKPGHGGAYPMPFDAKHENPALDDWGGTLEFGLDWEHVKNRPLTEMAPFLRAFSTHPAITVNHPRLGGDLGFFGNIGWAPPAPLVEAGAFDALEVLNGYMDDAPSLTTLMRDWFFLLSSGFRVTALGSSDTHHLNGVRAGFPRTWLRMPTELPIELLDSDLGDALRSQRAIASNGPFATLTVNGNKIGDVVTASGSVTIDATVDAPDWIDVDTVRLYVDGKKTKEYKVTTATRPRFQMVWQETLPDGSKDHWLLLSASGTKPLPPGLVTEPNITVTPLAVTNPIFIDGDGDKVWKPQIANPDPGPLGPPMPEQPNWGGLPPEECEPPLWTNPRKFQR